jgi:plasmid maintenance system antidote protein VapI
METLKVDRSKLYTQAEYARKIGVTRARINHMITAKELTIVEIKGAKLVYIK